MTEELSEEVPPDIPGEDESTEDLFSVSSQPVVVTSPAGAELKLLTLGEKQYYDEIARRYLEDNILTNVADLQELDRILVSETMCHRWSQWLLEEKDYFDEPVNVADLQRNIKDHSTEVRQIKKALGFDKATREKDRGSSVADYIHNLRLRAKEFGVMRNNQAIAAITLWKELMGIVTLHKNCTEEERTEFGAHEHDVIEWIIAKGAEFDKIDAEFRETQQKMWIRTV